MIKTIDGAAFSRMMLSAAAEIDLNKQKVNELNVFPVPDGDTGTNMSMTLSAASTELRKADGITLTKAADKTASALLRGARGNSGVILSLLFRGFSKSLKGKLEADGKDFAAALTAGVEAAYKAVMKPAEGTILTVSRLTADAARDLAVENNEIEYVLQHCLDTAHAALDNTVNQNPVLKKAGVVDAGGMGFCLILRGMLESLRGNDIVCEDTGAVNEEADFGIFDSEDITFAFDTVFIVLDESPAVLKTAGLSKRIRKEAIFEDISMSVPEGSVTAITGQNGAGKTTLAQILCGLARQTRGHILIDGKKARAAVRRRDIYYCGNDTSTQFFTASVAEELLLNTELTEESKDRARILLKELGLYEYRDAHPSTLSGGQKQRLAIACAIFSGCRILILDEPTSGLDGRNMRLIAERLKSEARNGRTILVITHDRELIESCCDRIAKIGVKFGGGDVA